jgi:carbonic anhydrase
MDRLLDGYRRFRNEVWPEERARYEKLADRAQTPSTLVVACSDSRVDPQTVFGAVPGELFVIRNVAGLVPPYEPDGGSHGTSAALEYGVCVLKVKRVVVLGHESCGGVQAMVLGAPREARDFVAPWMALAAPVLRRVPRCDDASEMLTACEHEIVRLSLENLRTFPWIAEAADAGRLDLLGFRFAIRTGILERLEGNTFAPVV